MCIVFVFVVSESKTFVFTVSASEFETFLSLLCLSVPKKVGPCVLSGKREEDPAVCGADGS